MSIFLAQRGQGLIKYPLDNAIFHSFPAIGFLLKVCVFSPQGASLNSRCNMFIHGAPGAWVGLTAIRLPQSTQVGIPQRGLNPSHSSETMSHFLKCMICFLAISAALMSSEPCTSPEIATDNSSPVTFPVPFSHHLG